MLRSIFLSAVLTAVIPVMNVLPAYAVPRGNAVADAKAEVMQAEETRNQALQKGDADALAKLYTSDLILRTLSGLPLPRNSISRIFATVS